MSWKKSLLKEKRNAQIQIRDGRSRESVKFFDHGYFLLHGSREKKPDKRLQSWTIIKSLMTREGTVLVLWSAQKLSPNELWKLLTWVAIASISEWIAQIAEIYLFSQMERQTYPRSRYNKVLLMVKVLFLVCKWLPSFCVLTGSDLSSEHIKREGERWKRKGEILFLFLKD